MEFEGFSPTPYRDENRVLTIGYGHTGEGVHEGLIWTMVQANVALDRDMLTADSVINRVIRVALTQNQHDALTSFVFNVGEGHFAGSVHPPRKPSTTFTMLNACNFPAASEAILLWNEAAGKVDPGLVRRRAAEKALFDQP